MYPIIVTDDHVKCKELVQQSFAQGDISNDEKQQIISQITEQIVEKSETPIIFVNFHYDRLDTKYKYDFRIFVTSEANFQPEYLGKYDIIHEYSDNKFSPNSLKRFIGTISQPEKIERVSSFGSKVHDSCKYKFKPINISDVVVACLCFVFVPAISNVKIS